MRALVLTIWIFINLIFFGMCGYMYLLWSQYWMYLEREIMATPSSYDQQIYYYNRGLSLTNDKEPSKNRTKHSIKGNNSVTLIKNSRPRFQTVLESDFELDTKKYACFPQDVYAECRNKSSEFKEKIVREMRRVLEDEGNVLKSGAENPYNVTYLGSKQDFANRNPKTLLCELKKIRVKTLKRGDVSGVLNPFLPKKGLFENRRFNSCAIVSSAGALKNSNLGKFIDSHDLVMRFNNAPTKSFESDVGKKTTIRVLNSQVVTRKEFGFLNATLYQNVTIAVWDPSDYKVSLDDWLTKPEYNLFPNYMEYRKSREKARIFLIHPNSLWLLWDFLQANAQIRLRKNPPSSGFLGLGILLQFCNFIDIFEYVPSTRASKLCHYYDPEENPACTFGVWHPLAAEKLISFHMNSADDVSVFQKGFIRIPGRENSNCA